MPVKVYFLLLLFSKLGFIGKKLLFLSINLITNYLLIPLILLTMVGIALVPWLAGRWFFCSLGCNIHSFWLLRNLKYYYALVATGYVLYGLVAMSTPEFQDIVFQLNSNIKHWFSVEAPNWELQPTISSHDMGCLQEVQEVQNKSTKETKNINKEDFDQNRTPYLILIEGFLIILVIVIVLSLIHI